MGTAPVIMSLIITFLCSNVHTWGRLKTQSPTLSPIYSWVGNIWPMNFSSLGGWITNYSIQRFLFLLPSYHQHTLDLGKLLATRAYIAS